ncbi:hypothetical protein MOV08_05170 [Streptomyces yunnanensis]|uniref:Phage terminase, small subunit, putative, P27 family n=1 Tax=Streptomyces yunnanensis TaxID=156453 RepID=A0ABY8A1F2_9ACTN|nr:hypothetical protein [Streptomyces yunnanensis]WEB38753.1 hypothetical protein MOV08_05170 [Streptomyces yunnanensis]
MATHGKGRLPKDNPMRRNKNPEEILEGRKVPVPVLRNGEAYHPETLNWWITWINSPQVEAFLPTDWERLQQLAALVNAYWNDPKASTLAEIRQNESMLGATVADRQRLRMKDQGGKTVQGTSNPAQAEPEISDEELYRMLNGGGGA